jgi:hypothetical protein
VKTARENRVLLCSLGNTSLRLWTFVCVQQAPEKRCLIKRALEMLDARNSDERNRYPLARGDVALFTRPDLLFTEMGGNLVADLANLASAGTLAFPFPCELPAWKQWQCAADTVLAAPAAALSAFRRDCVGRISCWPEARRTSVPTRHEFVTPPRDSFELGNWNRRIRMRRQLSAFGAARGSGSDIAKDRRAVNVGVESGRALFSEQPQADLPQPFDAMSREGTEDYNKLHGAVWKSGHGCYRCAIKVPGNSKMLCRQERGSFRT